MHVVHSHTCTQNTHTQKNKILGGGEEGGGEREPEGWRKGRKGGRKGEEKTMEEKYSIVAGVR